MNERAEDKDDEDDKDDEEDEEREDVEVSDFSLVRKFKIFRMGSYLCSRWIQKLTCRLLIELEEGGFFQVSIVLSGMWYRWDKRELA